MKFIITLILLSSVFFIPFSAYTHSPTASEIPVKSATERSVWKIQTPNGTGTGFFVDEKLLVTNFHIIFDTIEENTIKDISLSQEGNPSIFKIKKVRAISALHDLVLMETDITLNHLNLRDHPPKFSEPLFVPAYAGAFKTINTIGNIFHKNNYFHAFPINSLDIQGASGAPILDEQGLVVGLVFAGTYNILHAIKINHLEEFIAGKIGSNCSDFINVKSCIIREMESLTKLAERGHPPSQYMLAELHYNGEGTDKNFEQAFDWFEKAALQDFTPAQYNLAVLYDKARGTKENPEQAFHWYEKAAEQEHVQAKYNLAIMYKKGRGTQQNLRLAFEAFNWSALWGLIPAKYQLAIMYKEGKGTEKNPELALHWCKEAAEQGLADAQFMMGEFYEKGTGTKKSPLLAFQWYEKAAEQGLAEAQFQVGGMYEEGIGATKNLELAVKWYKKAEKQRFAKALYKLGMMYKEGKGLKKSLKKALECFTLAAEQGYHPAAQNNSSKSSFPCKNEFTKE